MKPRRFLIPEVVQTSAMDCGPAALKCLLEGFHVPVSYGRLREACQTDVDGTSIDTLEEVARQLGLDAEQVMLPVDQLLDPAAAALPAIVVVRQPGGLMHFLVAWRRHGRWVQVMDPATGRRWPTAARLGEDVYVHTHTVPASAWREWAGGDDSLRLLRRRIAQLGDEGGDALVRAAAADAGWRGLAALEAATRMVARLVGAGGLGRGGAAERLLASLFERARTAEGGAELDAVPDSFWSARPAAPSEGGEQQLLVRGAVLLQVRGLRSKDAAQGAEPGAAPPLPAELAAALVEPPSRPARALADMLRADGLFRPAVLAGALGLATAGAFVEALLLRGVIDASHLFGVARHRLLAMGVLLALCAGLLFVELPILSGVLAMGRRLETRLRLAFLEKIPRLADRYFRSRPASDMAERGHVTHEIRALPRLGAELLRTAMALAVTTAGIAWLDPRSAWLALLTTGMGIALPLALQPMLRERDLRQRSHTGALTRFYLDALCGLVALRSLAAERAVLREHESLLVEWAHAGRALLRAATLAKSLQAVLGASLAGWLLVRHLSRAGEEGAALLLVYWALDLPALGSELARLLSQYPAHRNRTLRLLEPLGALEESLPPGSESPARAAQGGGPVRLTFEDVRVVAGGHRILDGVALDIQAGSHVAVVGPSGAGKSSLAGLLLGWHRPASGRILVDGEPLDASRLDQLRRETAWVDPEVQLWNRSLYENLAYGNPAAPGRSLAAILDGADLRRTLEALPDGLQSTLGEGGALVSGGEGQRVRFARALGRGSPRLVILDEPFRGLDRERRRTLLARAREWFGGATLLCVTHDVGETRGFARVLVIDGGRVVEDDAPERLAAVAGSRYRALLDAEDALRAGRWSDGTWRRLRLDEGRLVPPEPKAGNGG